MQAEEVLRELRKSARRIAHLKKLIREATPAARVLIDKDPHVQRVLKRLAEGK